MFTYIRSSRKLASCQSISKSITGIRRSSHQAEQATTADAQRNQQRDSKTTEISEQPTQTSTKTQAQLDEELKLKLSALAGDGGEAGVEYEDGKPVAMKRG